jgi:hypothetical protein
MTKLASKQCGLEVVLCTQYGETVVFDGRETAIIRRLSLDQAAADRAAGSDGDETIGGHR